MAKHVGPKELTSHAKWKSYAIWYAFKIGDLQVL